MPELHVWFRINSLTTGKPGDRMLWRVEIAPEKRDFSKEPPADLWGGLDWDIDSSPHFYTFNEAHAWLCGLVFCCEIAICMGYEPELPHRDRREVGH